MEIRKLARPLAWMLGACMGLAVVAYAVLFVINWSDEAPSVDAVALTRIVASKPGVPDAANAWVFDIGLAAPEGQDPLDQGIARKAYLEQFAPRADQSYGFLPGREIQYKPARTPAITALATACKKGNAECVRLAHDRQVEMDGNPSCLRGHSAGREGVRTGGCFRTSRCADGRDLPASFGDSATRQFVAGPASRTLRKTDGASASSLR